MDGSIFRLVFYELFVILKAVGNPVYLTYNKKDSLCPVRLTDKKDIESEIEILGHMVGIRQRVCFYE